MFIHEVRAMNAEQLQQELQKTHRELMDLRFRAATNQLPNSNLPRSVRRTIARIETVIKERELTRS